MHTNCCTLYQLSAETDGKDPCDMTSCLRFDKNNFVEYVVFVKSAAVASTQSGFNFGQISRQHLKHLLNNRRKPWRNSLPGTYFW